MRNSNHSYLSIALATLLWFGGEAAGQDVVPVATIDSLCPGVGTVGTEITIKGTGFGLKRPRVYLTTEGSKAKRHLRVLESSETEITVLLRKADPGLHDLVVLPRLKGAVPATLADGFSVEPPQDLRLDRLDAEPFEVVTLTGRYIGTKRGKVLVGGKRAKILSWETEVIEVVDDTEVINLDPGLFGADDAEPLPALDVVRFEMPKALPNGSYEVEVRNRVATDVADSTMAMVNSTYGWPTGSPPKLTARVTGSTKFVGNKQAVWYEVDEVHRSIKMTGVMNDGNFRSLSLNVKYDPKSMADAALSGNDVISLGYTEVTTAVTNAWAALPGSVSVEILGNIDGTLYGTFSGTLFRVYGHGKETVSVTNGQFIVRPKGDTGY